MSEPTTPEQASTTDDPITPNQCAQNAAKILHQAAACAGIAAAEHLVLVAAGWRDLGVAMSNHYGMNPPKPQGTDDV